ncbi:CotY/CotZ family spore coat protein [Pontibacillus sp. HMF3514]|uniref:CotY/CotZ family spore coat protein n=1 Tax=Pontibacillus sp. HMF3514 TaxID=2692425 RepID=UPI00131F6E73|nr:CotY/CotZ family spore coat protein [Pontibacillus sp. HMF3514]QHE51481.1 spore coat protein [Pontibacillus sp. HMF3514]
MGCGKRHDTGSCVCDILKEIVDAQNDVTDDCNSSCEQSINELMGDVGGNSLDTVPVILYCKDCKPFKGFGARRGEIGDIRESFIFRVKEVDEDCECALLELLLDPSAKDDKPDSPSCQKTDDLTATGICITVDLRCFCHITCLPAIDAMA